MPDLIITETDPIAEAMLAMAKALEAVAESQNAVASEVRGLRQAVDRNQEAAEAAITKTKAASADRLREVQAEIERRYGTSPGRS